MSNHSCPNDSVLTDFLAGRLEEAQAGVLEEHLLVCETCIVRARVLPSGDELDRDMRRLPDVNAITKSGEKIDDLVAHIQARVDGVEGAVELPEGYTYLGILGRGGMGIVYKARQNRLNRVVALKMLLPHDEASADECDRFRAEALAIARLRHPNIVQIFEAGEHRNRPYFALELIEGGSLARFMSDNRLSPITSARLVELLANAIHVAHQHGIIHRDLKPANVLLDTSDRADAILLSGARFEPKVTDFGLAKNVGQQGMTQPGQVMGTAAYMSPEQARGQTNEIGPATDVYGLGGILYQSLTGRPPFQGASFAETIAKVLSESPTPPSVFSVEVPRKLEAICLRCLAKPVADRFPTAKALADELRQFLDAATGSDGAVGGDHAPALPPCNDDLVRRLPLPLAQLVRRAFNAKSPRERHQTAYFLWEATLKLLGFSGVVAYVKLGDQDAELTARLQNLARPTLTHWWEFTRRLVPILADRAIDGFAAVRDLLLGRSRDDLPWTGELDAALIPLLDGQEATIVRSVRLTEVFERLVRYRALIIGATPEMRISTLRDERLGRLMLGSVMEILERLDPLAGRRLIYVADVRRHISGRWLVERYELRGDSARRLESLDLEGGADGPPLQAGQLFVEAIAGGQDNDVDHPWTADSLHPLLTYDPESTELFFLQSRRDSDSVGYLSYTTGRESLRADLVNDHHAFLRRLLRRPIEAAELSQWAASSRAEDPNDIALAPRPAPRRLGEFELLSELGRGGMGVVYRAWQPSLGRQVAVKALFRTGDPKAEARFVREIRALGRVEHLHLVKIFTSGSDGEQWFFAMELIEGATLAAVCEKLQSRSSSPATVDSETWLNVVSTACSDARRSEKPVNDLTIGEKPPMITDSLPVVRPSSQSYVRQVVELIRQVSEAAHSLHERSILHRDIKPGNIMVTAESSQAVLMDLGLAQIADEVEGRLTKTRQFVGTLRYASPEQVLAVGNLDRRSDVYNLGATLWELLTFRPLFGATEQMPTPDLMRRIQTDEPERPRKYHPKLSRDLEAIVLKCLEKDPSRRYPTARELARDLERYQKGDSVTARQVGTLQRSWRWCRRNPTISGMLALLLVVIVGSILGLTQLYLNAERERAVADDQRKIAQHKEAGSNAIARFYEDHVLAAARPKGWAGGTGKHVSLKEALDQSVPKIDSAFANQPELNASVRHTLGMTYFYLSQYDSAAALLESAHEVRSSQLGANDPETLRTLDGLALTRWKQDRYRDAVALGRQAFEGRRRALGADHEETVWSQLHLVDFLSEDRLNYDEAEILVRAAIETCERNWGSLHQQTAYAYHNLAFILNGKDKFSEAVVMDEKALKGRTHALGADHPETLRSMDNLAYSLESVGRKGEAEPLMRKALEGRRRVLGDDHVETLWSLNHLGHFHRSRKEFGEAEKTYRQVLDARRRVLGPKHGETIASISNLAGVLLQQGKKSEVETLHTELAEFRRAMLEDKRRQLGTDHEETLQAQQALAFQLHIMGKKEASLEVYRELFETNKRLHGIDHPKTVFVSGWLLHLLEECAHLEEAERITRDQLKRQRSKLKSDDPSLAQTLIALGSQLNKLKRPTEAEPYLRECIAIREKNTHPSHWQVLAAKSILGECLALQKEFEKAETLLVKSYEGLFEANARADTIARALERLIELYEGWGKSAEAEKWRQKRVSPK